MEDIQSVGKEKSYEDEVFKSPGEPKSEPVSEKEEVTELTDEERASFESLLTLGKTCKTFDVLGHPVTLETMTVADELRVGEESRDYRNTEAFARAYQAAVVAASVKSLDGVPLYIPLSSEETSSFIFQKKLEKVHKMYPIVVSEIYRKYIEVEKVFASLAEKLGKLQG